jgi:hypothetical protein
MTTDQQPRPADTGPLGLESFSSHFRVAVVGRIFLARWFRAPQRHTLQAIVKALAAESTRLGAPVVYCVYIGPDAEVLNEASRRLLAEFEPEVLQHAEAIHVVFAGSGLVVKMLLAARRAINLGAPHRKRVRLHASLDEFLAQVDGSVGTTPAAVVEAVDTLRRTDVAP